MEGEVLEGKVRENLNVRFRIAAGILRRDAGVGDTSRAFIRLGLPEDGAKR
jgi:hypothetical protein